jgi:hypothetical protein
MHFPIVTTLSGRNRSAPSFHPRLFHHASSRPAALAGVIAFFAVLPAWAGEVATRPDPPVRAEFPTPIEGAELTREEWAFIEMKGNRVGYTGTVTFERVTPQGRQFITQDREEMKISRMGETMHVESGSKVTEDENGRVLNFEQFTRGSGSDKTLRGFRVGDEMVILSGGTRNKVPIPATALGPAALDRRTREIEAEKGANLELSAFMADMPHRAVTVKIENQGKENVEVNPNDHRELWKYTSTLDLLPWMPVILYADDNDDVILATSEVPLIGKIRMLSCTKEEALEQLKPAEIFAPSLITPDRPLPNYRNLKHVVYIITAKATDKSLELHDGEGQRILESAPGRAKVDIRLAETSTASYRLPHESTPEMAPYLESSVYIESTPRIKELAAKAVGDTKNPAEAARRIETFVRSYISNKDLTVNFASAEETAVSKAGDCTEHAVLCAALGRAAGLPTRVVTGLGYLPFDYANQHDASKGTFGFHMWAEAYLGDGQWSTMDAALDGRTVGHIALKKTPLTEANPSMDLALPILNLVQDLKIQIEVAE